MCGLFGAYSNALYGYEIDLLTQLGVMSSLRGRDSTGIAVFRKHKNKTRYEIFKEVGSSSEHLYSDRAQKMLRLNNTFLVLGHCRYATSGTVNAHNAHPIWDRNIIACHNGVIRKFEPPANLKDTESDTRELVRKLVDKGLPALRDVGWDGAYALTYVDLASQTLNFIRNSKRPLWMMYNNNYSTLFWASEKGMLDLLAERNSEGFKEPGLLAEGEHWQIKLGSMEVKTAKPDVTPLYSTSVVYPTHNVPSTQKVVQTGSPFLDGTHYRGYGGNLFPAQVVKQIVERQGCSGCHASPPLTENIAWFGSHTFLCEECMSMPLMRDMCNLEEYEKGELVTCN